MTEAIRSRVLKSFGEFASYFETLGAPKPKTPIGVDIAAEEYGGVIAYYDPATHKVMIGTEFLSDPSVPYREYAHSVLFDDAKSGATDYERTWEIAAIESGLASYFSSSLRNDPLVPGIPGESLKNDNKISAITREGNLMSDGLLAWGGTFWDLRSKLGQKTTDRLLYRAWTLLTSKEIATNNPAAFARRLLEADKQLSSSENVEIIRAVLTARGLSL